jgi:hypothetical protein
MAFTGCLAQYPASFAVTLPVTGTDAPSNRHTERRADAATGISESNGAALSSRPVLVCWVRRLLQREHKLKLK